jgi:sugar/nucleoside kinase (ribokinase family)
MRASLLVVGAPTLDYIRGSWRPGGPGLYAAAAASLAGCRVEVLGPVGSEDLHLIAPSYRELGATLKGPLVAGCSYRFSHRYTRHGRASSIECKPSPLSASDLRLAAERYDAVLVSPVGCEVPRDVVELALARASRASALDLQGYARCGLLEWIEGLGGLTLIHYSSDDPIEDVSLPRGGVTAYTEGASGGQLLSPAGFQRRLPPPPRLLEDPTGAGDAFTALAICIYTVEDEDPVNAATRAVELVPKALETAWEVLRET